MGADGAEEAGSRWRWRDWKGTWLTPLLAEWKYFNFQAGDQAGIIGYVLPDPLRRTGLAAPYVFARLHGCGEGLLDLSRTFAPSDVTTSDHCVDAAFGPACTLRGAGPKGIAVAGRIGELAWELEYQSEGFAAWHAFRRLAVAPRPVAWLVPERLSWEVTMPAARVTGRLHWAGRTLEVDGVGYCDTDWGEWLPVDPMWAWGQFNGRAGEVPYACVVGDLWNRTRCGEVALWLGGGGRRTFSKARGEYRVESLDWRPSGGAGAPSPQLHRVTGEAGDARLDLTVGVEVDHVYDVRLPGLPVALRVSEQRCRFRGRLEAGGVQVFADAPGYFERTARALA